MEHTASGASVAMAELDCAVALQAAIDGNLRLLKYMAKKVNLREARNANGASALHCAASNGHLEVCRFLVEESGLDVNFNTTESGTPIHSAAAGGNGGVLRYLLDRGGDPAMQDSGSGGSTPLHHAAVHGHCEAVRLLLSKGVDVDPLISYGTPLHLAASQGHDQVVKILLEHGADAGADINFVSVNGLSVLIAAVSHGLIEIVKFLLDAGADPNIPDKEGTLPIMTAAANENRELVEILFPWTRPIPVVPAWSIDGIIMTMKHKPQESVEKQMADAKSQAKEAFANGDFLYACNFYELAIRINPLDGTLFANRSPCWLRLREGERYLSDARDCKALRPRWAKAWYREGAALSLLKNYKGAVDAFSGALKLDPENDDIKKALREAMESMRNAGHSG